MRNTWILNVVLWIMKRLGLIKPPFKYSGGAMEQYIRSRQNHPAGKGLRNEEGEHGRL